MEKEKEQIKVFISYSWSSPDHEQRVLNLATVLREEGLDVILDKWDLKEGNDAIVFMEKMVSDSSLKKVIMICDKVYAEKANARKGGVGAEAQIISKELYNKTDQNKFVAVVVEKDEQGNACLPIYYKSRIYIDLSQGSDYTTNFEQLLRWAYDKPLYIKPALGSVPKFLDNQNQIAINTNLLFRQVTDSIKNQKENRNGLLNEYFDLIVNNFEKFRICYEDTSIFDDLVIENIGNFIPYRNEFIEIVSLLALYGVDDNIINIIYRFFESLIPFLFNPEEKSQCREWDFDNYKFIIQELFLYLIAVLLGKEKFDLVSKFISKKFYYAKNSDYERNTMVHFSIFRNYLRSLEERNKKLKLRRLSLKADILKERSVSSGISFNNLMQADFVLFIRGLFDFIRYEERTQWYPDTLLYTNHWPRPFEIFSRSESKSYFNNVKVLFNIDKKEDFLTIFELLNKNDSLRPRWEFDSPDVVKLLNFENLCKIN